MLLSNELASDPRVEKEAAALSTAGWRVTVLAWNRSGTLPTHESRHGFDIVRLGPRAGYGGGVRNLRAFRSFWRSAARQVVEMEPEVVHCHDLDTVPAGLAACRRSSQIRLVIDFHELYRESRMVPAGRLAGTIARVAIDALERRALARADALIVAWPAMVDRYAALGANPVVVENAPDAVRFNPDVARDPHEGFRVCYAGQKRYTGSLFALMDAVQADSRLCARIAGGGVAADSVADYAQHLKRVEVLGPFTYDEAPALYRGCDAVYAAYDSRVGNIRLARPVKTLEGMACGLPVVVNADTWIGDYVEREGVGVTVSGESAAEIAHALGRLAEDPTLARRMGERGRALVDEGLNWEEASHRLIGMYERLLRRRLRELSYEPKA
jgi:glycosyltransferase involved in cell wall biosynthesis